MGAPPVGLRARKKHATAVALRDASVALFLERGYDATTVQDITDAAGVSQRTFFRYFATKDAVLLAEHDRREGELRDLLPRLSGQPVHTILEAVAAHLGADVAGRGELVPVQAQVFLTTPALADRFSGHQDRLTVMVAEFLAVELQISVDADPRPRLLATQAIRSWTTAILVSLTEGQVAADLAERAVATLRLMRSDPIFVDAS